jgi:hypothetical protein
VTYAHRDFPALDQVRAPFCYPPEASGRLQVRGCCIRFEDSAEGPYILADSSHRCVGVGEVRVLDGTGRIEIISSEDVGAIISCHVTVDESFATAGFNVGPSGGAEATVVQFGHRSGTAYHGLSAGLYAVKRNIWCSWKGYLPGV